MRAASSRAARLAASALVTALAFTSVSGNAHDAAAAPAAQTSLTVTAKRQSWVFRDGDGREVTLRGFNVSGSTKLYENSLLPFRSIADAARSAQAMRDLTGANVIRFL